MITRMVEKRKEIEVVHWPEVLAAHVIEGDVRELLEKYHSPFDIHLEISDSGLLWISVMDGFADGSCVFSDYMEPGDDLAWDGEQLEVYRDGSIHLEYEWKEEDE